MTGTSLIKQNSSNSRSKVSTLILGHFVGVMSSRTLLIFWAIFKLSGYPHVEQLREASPSSGSAAACRPSAKRRLPQAQACRLAIVVMVLLRLKIGVLVVLVTGVEVVVVIVVIMVAVVAVVAVVVQGGMLLPLNG